MSNNEDNILVKRNNAGCLVKYNALIQFLKHKSVLILSKPIPRITITIIRTRTGRPVGNNSLYVY